MKKFMRTQRSLTGTIMSFLMALVLSAAFISQTASALTITLLGGGETTPPSGYHRTEQANSAVTYGGNWNTESSNLTQSFSGGTAATSMGTGAQASFKFAGTAVHWVGYRDAWSGIADVYLDGTLQSTVDTYSLTPTSETLIFSASGLTAATHTLTIKVKGTHSLLALGSSVWVDAFDYKPLPPDTTPPTVSMITPADGTTVSGTIKATASASDNVGVVGVQFQLDGVNLGAEAKTAPYAISWNTTTTSNGSHTLDAVARDAAGNKTTSATVTVTVSNSSGDTTPPTVSMTAPANGATVSGSVAVSANASDNVGVVGVQFKLDGANLGAEDTSAPYSISWDTTAAANGSHSLTAVARDAAGNHSTSSPVSVTVSNSSADTTPPTVAMTAPANGSTVSGNVTVSANASDNVAVAGVQFQLNGANLGAEDTAAPYSISWDTTTVANGSYTLDAIARDSSGNRTTSSAVSATVSNSSGGTTTRVEDDDPAVVYAGTWIVPNDPSLSGNTAHESFTANSTATFTFTGTGVTWISYKCACTAGIAEVSVDGGTPTQVDTYAANAQPQAPVFSVNGLPRGTHTIKITVTGNMDPAGNSAYILVDAFDVTN